MRIVVHGGLKHKWKWAGVPIRAGIVDLSTGMERFEAQARQGLTLNILHHTIPHQLCRFELCAQRKVLWLNSF